MAHLLQCIGPDSSIVQCTAQPENGGSNKANTTQTTEGGGVRDRYLHRLSQLYTTDYGFVFYIQTHMQTKQLQQCSIFFEKEHGKHSAQRPCVCGRRQEVAGSAVDEGQALLCEPDGGVQGQAGLHHL